MLYNGFETKLKKTKIYDFSNWIKKNYITSDISKYIFHLVFSIFIGLFAGLAAIIFRTLLEWMRHFFEFSNVKHIFQIDFNPIFIVPVIGGIIIAVITRAHPDIAKERGVVSVIKAVMIQGGYIPLKNTIFHFIAPLISIGSGIPLGPEGPSAKIGGGAGSLMTQVFHLHQREMKMYTAAGAGAAISAVFNAPIAGVFFGIEVILLNDLKNQALSALIISSVVADVLSLAILGNNHVFNIPKYSVGSAADFPYFLLAGILCGVISILFFKLRNLFRFLINKKFKKTNEFVKLLPVALLFGFVLIEYPSLYGIGYSTINEVLNDQLMIHSVLILLFLKLVFISLFLEVGAYGGIFAPSLVLGALLGFAFSNFINFLPGVHTDPVVFALVSMGGVLAGINSIPLTSILLVFEITNDYKFILPLMFVSIISYLWVIYVNKGSTYALELLHEGIDVSKRGEMDLLSKIRVKDIKKTNFDVVNHSMHLKGLVKILMNSNYSDVFVIDDKKQLLGIISLKEIRQILETDELNDLLIARDITMPVPIVTDDDPLSVAIHKIEEYNLQTIPVVKTNNYKKIIGVLTHQEILHSYYALLEKWGDDQFLIDYSRKK